MLYLCSVLRRIAFIILLFCLVLPLSADLRITLQDGSTLEGEVVIDNDEVIILKDQKGRRYQFPQSQVTDKQEIAAPVTEEQIVEQRRKQVGILFGLSGSASFLPANEHQPASTAGQIGAEVLIGAKNMLGTHIFLGGGIAYNGYLHPADNLSAHFLPLKIYAKIPVTDQKHAPALTAGLGYGFALKKGTEITRGGLFAEMGIGWNLALKRNKSLYVGANCSFQQCQSRVATGISGISYTDYVGRAYITLGIKTSIIL